MQIARASEVEIAARGWGQEIDLVAREDELPVRRHEAQLARLFSPTRQAHAGVKDGEVECARGGCFAARGGEREEEVGHARDFRREGDGAVGKCGEGEAGGGKDYREGFDDVDVEFVAGVTDVGATPRDGGAGGGGVKRELMLETCGGIEGGGGTR